MSDEEIIQRFVNGETAAVGTVTEWIRSVVLRRKWGDSISPEDIIANTRAKLLLKLVAKSAHVNSSFEAYVRRTAKYTAVDALRDHIRTKGHVARLRLHIPDNPTPIQLLLSEEESRQFVKIRGRVRKECRALWDMLFRDKLMYNEIAVRLGITEQTLRVRLFRCKNEAITLRKKLE